MTKTIESVEGFEELHEILAEAYKQATHGKGQQRHGQTRPFNEQTIMRETELTGSTGFVSGQARKKILEAMRLRPRQARHEVLGAIIYAAAAGIWYRRLEDVENDSFVGGHTVQNTFSPAQLALFTDEE